MERNTILSVFCHLWMLPTPLISGQTVGNGTLYSSTLVHSVQSMYLSCYAFSNKAVLSYPLSRYLLVHTLLFKFKTNIRS
jgi:hypothetical protein